MKAVLILRTWHDMEDVKQMPLLSPGRMTYNMWRFLRRMDTMVVIDVPLDGAILFHSRYFKPNGRHRKQTFQVAHKSGSNFVSTVT